MIEKKGNFYIVGTPIGNLEDMTFRAIAILKKVGVVFCEDTRKTKHLFNHFEIITPLESYYKDVEIQKLPKIVEKLKMGIDVALVSDAGMPLICDPGELLVKTLVDHGITIIPIPGACALITALAISGLDTQKFIFEGFFPKKKSERTKKLLSLKQERRTLVFYESPYRIAEAIKAVYEVFGDRQIVVARELTKMYEQISRGFASEVLELFEKAKIPQKGEFVLLIAGNDEPDSVNLVDIDLKEEILKAMDVLGITKKEAVIIIAKEFKLAKKVVYRAGLAI